MVSSDLENLGKSGKKVLLKVRGKRENRQGKGL